eukprot:5867941-Prymnesium_polylepis.1
MAAMAAEDKMAAAQAVPVAAAASTRRCSCRKSTCVACRAHRLRQASKSGPKGRALLVSSRARETPRVDAAGHGAAVASTV